ncbi:nucleotide sugar dehydrogenase [Candidatus Saccharibacteria bacterium]|nr:nucleotide sugar dehydrogenase [Candidatus Saccharibacteria bacterium]
MKITVAGAGYVGLSLATLIAQNHHVTLLDIVQEKVDMINDKKSPIKDKEIEDFFANKTLYLNATTSWRRALKGADYVIVATPTNYDSEKNYFDTSSIEDIIEKVLALNTKTPDGDCPTTIIIKSTVPVGYTEKIKTKYNINNVIFSPEFLREGHALYDNLYPSRIIIGDKTDKAKKFAALLLEGAIAENVPVKYMYSTEAEAVKLFANTYLALRVAYFNELDTYAELQHLNAKDIIDGVCLDPRIGNHYNNPSFGYGGYCLPKDTKQLRANYHGIPQTLISAVVEANTLRKEHITDMILAKNPKTVGIYRLTMKAGSDNFRFSAIKYIMKLLDKEGIKVIVYEPTVTEPTFKKYPIENNLDEFKNQSDIIVANRIDDKITDVLNKVYTRDLYARD